MSNNTHFLSIEQRAKLVIIQEVSRQAMIGDTRIHEFVKREKRMTPAMMRYSQEGFALCSLMADILFMLQDNPSFFRENDNALDEAALKALALRDSGFQHADLEAATPVKEGDAPEESVNRVAPRKEGDAPEEKVKRVAPRKEDRYNRAIINILAKKMPAIYRNVANWLMIPQAKHFANLADLQDPSDQPKAQAKPLATRVIDSEILELELPPVEIPFNETFDELMLRAQSIQEGPDRRKHAETHKDRGSSTDKISRHKGRKRRGGSGKTIVKKRGMQVREVRKAEASKHR